MDHRQPQTKFLRLIFVDVSGVRRCRVVPIHPSPTGKRDVECFPVAATNASRTSKRLWVHHRSRLALVCYFLPCYGDEAVVETAWKRGDIIIEPAREAKAVELPSCDWMTTTSFRSLGAPTPFHPWCMRSLLWAAQDRLKREFGIVMRIGFETEFVLLDDKTREPIETSVYCQTSGFDMAGEVLREITQSLTAIGQTVLHLHGESAPGQFEIVTDHSDDVLEQADAFVYRKEVIQMVARRHGMLASFLPKIWSTQAGNASHVHFSLRCVKGHELWKDKLKKGESDGNDTLVHGVLSRPLACFMDGLLRDMDGLLLHTVGSPNSWRRVQPGCWAGAYACWGVQNKEAPLRVIDADENHVEFKAFDGTANPYMGLAAIICAGMAGLSRMDEFDARAFPEPVSFDPQHLSSQKPRRLPTNSFEELVKASLGNHIEDKFTRAAEEGTMEHEWLKSMGCCVDAGVYDPKEEFQAFFEDFARVKLAEVARFKEMTFEEEVNLLLDRY